jgi:hypothetical protein
MSLVLATGWEVVDLLNNYFDLKKNEEYLGHWGNQPVWVLRKKSFSLPSQ